MKIKLDTLKCVKLMTQHGLPTENTEAVVSGLTATEIDNVYANTEIDNMIERVTRNIRKDIDAAIARQDAKYEHRFNMIDARLNALDAKIELIRKNLTQRMNVLEAGIADIKSYFRWVVGTILGANTAISASIVAYFHFFH